jgi:DNA-binding NarL/FixJ family response regulator
MARIVARFQSLPPVKIVIIEDHKLVRDMLAVSCRGILPGAEVEVASDGREGLALCERQKPELVFLDLVLPDADGLELVPKIFSASPQSKVIALSSFADEFTVHRALRANVHGFVDKNEQPLDVLKEAIETVQGGKTYFSSAVQQLKASLRSDPASFDKLLSDHEQRLLSLFGEGLSNEVVAEKVGLSASTVKAHRRNILSKLGIHSTPELIHYALEKGFTRVRRPRL